MIFSGMTSFVVNSTNVTKSWVWALSENHGKKLKNYLADHAQKL